MALLATLSMGALGQDRAARAPDSKKARTASNREKKLDATQERPALTILVPAYFYPAGAGLAEWERLIKASDRFDIVAIVNPASGPGERRDENYKRILARAEASSLTLIGYVSTRYATRNAAEVEADIDRWGELYPGLDGFFFDEQTSQAERSGFYARLFGYARGKQQGAEIYSNPGVMCAQEYFIDHETLHVCAHEKNQGFEALELPPWSKGVAAERFAGLAHGVESSATMQKQLRLAVEKGFGAFYVTDAKGANPWDRLPSYWEEELAAIEQLDAKRKEK